MSSSLIKYRINSVTSQSPQYPASNLTDQSISMGWQSEYSPSYPQQLNLQFFTPIRTKTMKLTFHQYKIPTLVEVFVRLTAKQNYRKLGFIVPNDNSQSSYQHKQIKTLYFEFPCNFIKLVFYQNYKNQMNLFEQVALEDLKIEGQAMTYGEIRNIDLGEEVSSQGQVEGEEVRGSGSSTGQQQRPKLPQYSSNVMQVAGMQQLNRKFSQVYAYLQTQKSQAVQKQDFRLAGHLKNVIQTFKANQSQIISLEMQKRQALEEEDFDKCHRIKLQIQKQKEEFQYRVEQMYQDEENFMSEFSHSRILQDPERLTERKGVHVEEKVVEEVKGFGSGTPEREYESSVGKNKSGQHGKKLSLNLNSQNFNNISTVSQSQSLTNPNKVVDHNEQIIPAVRNKLMGIKQQSTNEFPQPTSNRSVYDESKNYSSVGGRNRSKSPPKSPTRKVVTKAHSYVAIAESNMSLKSPIISYSQIQYQQQLQIKQQTFSPQQKQQQPLAIQHKQHHRSRQMQELIDRLQRLEVEPLDLKLRLKLESHFEVIEEPYWQMIMHKAWSVKKQALEHVRDDVAIDSKQAYMAVMQFISFSINDPHPQVLLTTLNLLRKLIQQGTTNSLHFTLPHLPYFIQTIANSLLSLITSTNKQLSEQAYNLYLMLGMVGFLTVQYLVQKLIKHKQTTKVTPQYTVMKISLMISMIERYQQTVKYFKEILLWAVEFLKDPNNKVRSQASYVILILVDVIGEDKVISVIKQKPQHLKAYQEVLNNSQLIQSSRLDSVGEGSRYTDNRNLSKLQDISLSAINNSKSLSKERGALKNKSQVSQNPSSMSTQQQQQQKSSKRLKNPWTSNDQKSQKPRSNSRSRLDSQRNDDQLLQYSKESEFYGSSIKRQVQRKYSQSQLSENVLDKSEGEMKVMDENESDYWNEKKGKELQEQFQDVQASHEQEYEQEEEQEDSGKCDYCFMDMNGMDQRQHLLTQCKVLVSCEECMGRVYIRETIYHLLNECTNHTHHQQCKKCGLVFNIDEINEHVGQGLCRLQRGEGWERCQFCGQDVVANDMKWVDHAYKCTNLPQPPELTQKQSQSAD